MSQNSYFQSLPSEVQQALGKSAFDSFVNFPPPFEFTKHWDTLPDLMKMRYFAMVETIFNQIENLEGHVSTQLDLFNMAKEVLENATQRFEAIRPDDTNLNNYQLLEWLRSANAEIVNARLLMNRADIESGRHQDSGDESTKRVSIPNVKNSE